MCLGACLRCAGSVVVSLVRSLALSSLVVLDVVGLYGSAGCLRACVYFCTTLCIFGTDFDVFVMISEEFGTVQGRIQQLGSVGAVLGSLVRGSQLLVS